MFVSLFGLCTLLPGSQGTPDRIDLEMISWKDFVNIFVMFIYLHLHGLYILRRSRSKEYHQTICERNCKHRTRRKCSTEDLRRRRPWWPSLRRTITSSTANRLRYQYIIDDGDKKTRDNVHVWAGIDVFPNSISCGTELGSKVEWRRTRYLVRHLDRLWKIVKLDKDNWTMYESEPETGAFSGGISCELQVWWKTKSLNGERWL